MVKVILEVRWIKTKTALVKSRIYDIDYALNPYVGCQHGCVYCYSRFMSKYVRERRDWGSYVYVKINLPRILASEVKKKKPGTVLISSVTDPYQPIEKKYEITRRALEILSKTMFKPIIMTKSDLALRDIDIIKKISDIEVGYSISTIIPMFSEILEPSASPPEKRIKALETFSRNKVSTFVFIAPFTPYLSEEGINVLFDMLSQIKIDRVVVDTLNIRYGNIQDLIKSLNKLGFWEKVREVLASENLFFNYYSYIKNQLIAKAVRKGLRIYFLF